MCACEALITFPTPRKIKLNVSNYCNMPHIVNLLIFEPLIDFAAKSNSLDTFTALANLCNLTALMAFYLPKQNTGNCISLTCFAMWSKRVQYQVFAHLCHEDKSVHTKKFDLNFASTANICQFYGCTSLLQSSLNQIQMWHLRALTRWANLARK